MKPLRVAVVGAGHLGKIHARLLSQLPEARVAAVVDVDPVARERTAAEVGARPVAQPRELIGRVDAAVVATPTGTHAAIGEELLAGGLHVLMEKPLAHDSAGGQRLVQLARRNHRVLQVGHVERFNPAVAHLAEMGSPRYLEAARASKFGFRCLDVGVVLDLMIHDIDLALALTGSPVVHVEAWGRCVLSGHEDLAKATLTFGNGCVAHLSAGRVCLEPARWMRLLSDAGFAQADLGTRTATVVRPNWSAVPTPQQLGDFSPAQRTRFQETLFETTLPAEERPAPKDANPLRDELADFVHAVQSGGAPRVTGEQGLAALEVAERVLEAIDASQAGNLPAREEPAAKPRRRAA